MKEKIRGMREERAGGDRGFTLIELLVVVVIIGVLVGIAIPVYLNYREGAQNKSAQSDVRNAITAVEACYTEGGNTYPVAAVQIPDPGGNLTCGSYTAKVTVSDDNVLEYAPVGPSGYTIKVTNNDTGKSYTYNSATGQTTES